MDTNPPSIPLSTAAEPADSTIHDARQRRRVLVAVCVALMAVIASVTGLNVAQPELAVEFGASQSEVLWFINLYTISLAALLLPLGALGDRWGRKPLLLTGLIVFGVANVAAGLATSSEMMLASRFASGVGATMIMPVTLAVITSTFPEGERSKGIGVWTAVGGGGGLLGMYLSALGAVTSVIAVLGLVFALHEGPVHGWTEPATLLALVGGTFAAVGFVVWELRQAGPLLELRLFRERGLAGGS